LDADIVERFAEIKRMWEERLPLWLEEYAETGEQRHDPYFRDWITEFTPIEYSVWSDIRSSGVPFYPQLPICGYFLDFANPFKKIAIECDGKEFHDAERDAIRDKKLEKAGWIVFRIKGHECNRILPDPWNREEYYEGPSDQEVHTWFNTTSTGVVHAINHMFFAEKYGDGYKSFANENIGEVYRTLADHCTTKATLQLAY